MSLILNGDTGISAVDGTASAPALVGNDTDTGVWFPAANTAAISTGGSERMRITSGGELLVGVTSAQDGSILQVKGSGNTSATKAFLVEDSSGNDDFYIRGDGFLFSLPTYNNTTGSAANMFVGSNGDFYRSTSSLKYKTDVQDATHGLAKVLQLRPVTYKGKAENDGNKVFGGLIAEEVDAIGLKEFVQYAEDGSPDALAYSNMVSLLAKAIQELNAKVETQAVKIAELEAK
jgi:hypothetical protein